MKTFVYICQHRIWRALLLLLLFSFQFSAFNGLSAQGVEDGEAFYIYRNDGDFDGFFYDQVEEMRYSKVGVNGLEYNDYVTYEVVTADSTFRIPLAAIDSIGFVQPPIEFNPIVRHMDLLGMTDYITEVDGMTLTFSSSLPAELRPQIGNVLLGFTGPLEENGFGGRVANVSHSGGNISVVCDPLEKISDIFKRFISVEEIGTNPEGTKTVRRMAGYNKLREAYRRVAEGANTTLIDASLNGHFSFLPDNYGFHAYVDLMAAFKMRLAMVCQIESDFVFTKAMLTEDYSVQAGFNLGVQGGDFKEIPFISNFSIKFPTTVPLFEIRPLPNFGVRWSGDISAKGVLPPISGQSRQTFIIDTDAEQTIRYQGNENDKYPDITPSGLFNELGAGITFNGSLQVGVRERCGIFTNSWLERIFTAGISVDFYVGPKIDANISLSATIGEAGDGPYMLRNNGLSGTWMALDYEAKAECDIGRDRKDTYTFADGSFALMSRWEMKLLPTLDLRKAEYNKKARSIDAEMETNECMVFMPSEIGIGLMNMDKTDILSGNYLSKLSFGDKVPFFLQTNFSAKDLKPGKYNVVPLIKFRDTEYPVRSLAKEVEVPPYLELSEDTVKAVSEEGKYKVFFKTNANYIKAEVVGWVDWLMAEVVKTSEDAGYIEVDVGKNGKLELREAPIRVFAKDFESDLSTSDTICIIQQQGAIKQVKLDFNFTYTSTDGSSGEMSIYRYPDIDATMEMGDDGEITISGSQTFTDQDYTWGATILYDQGENRVGSSFQFNLTVKDGMLSGTASISGTSYAYRETHLDVGGDFEKHIYEQLNRTTNINVSFHDVPMQYDRQLEAYFVSTQGISASGTITHNQSYYATSQPPQETNYVHTITGGTMVQVNLIK